MNKTLTIIAICSIMISALSGAATLAQVLSPGLANILADPGAATDSAVAVVVFLDQDKPQAAAPRQAGQNRHERLVSLIERLKVNHGRNFAQVESYLGLHGLSETQRFWIVPAYATTLPLSRLDRLAAMDGVVSIVQDAPLTFTTPVEIAASSEVSVGISEQLELMNVPNVWHRGIKGAGRLVCSFDTGVEQDHPALIDKWRGNHTDLNTAWFSSVAPDTLPYDARGHGTHTMGIMVGAMEADSFGVAPDAEWITAGVVDQGLPLQTTFADIIAAYQWALNPDGDDTTTDDVPDVILNSWGVPKGLFTPCDQTFAQVIEVAEEAGIVTIFAAGNEGPDPMSLRSPADLPIGALSTFAVGAVNNNKVITSFSSRGPSSCDQTEIKPEMVACGSQIRSSQRGGGFAVMSGTSMAAPYIAGLVALARQYNPEATVEQIKTALIVSAEDLGEPGEDNTYGYGFPDAERMIELLPSPDAPDFSLTSQLITGDGIALPGETIGLQLGLLNPLGNLTQVTGKVSTASDAATVVNGTATFHFGPSGTSATNLYPFTLAISENASHGSRVSLSLKIFDADQVLLDSLEFYITIGLPYSGNMADMYAGRIECTVSDFGQFGFADGSIYQAGGHGFTFDGGENLLYEAGLVIGRNALQLSCGIRDSLGQYAASDFAPSEELHTDNATSGEQSLISKLIDTNSEIPIPIAARQKITSYDYAGDFVVYEYQLQNYSVERISGLRFGFFTDFDLTQTGESCVLDAGMNLLYYGHPDGPLVGILGLDNIAAFHVLTNEGEGKSGMTGQEIYNLLADDSSTALTSGYADYMSLAGSVRFDLEPFDTATVAFAVVAGADQAELYDNVMEARRRYDIATDVEDGRTLALPTDISLHQNYPNPFNPNTTISFDLQRAGNVTLELFNSLGRRVRTLVAESLPAGHHEVAWDSRSDNGQPVASGVYFYRLQTKNNSMTRKMLLLK